MKKILTLFLQSLERKILWTKFCKWHTQVICQQINETLSKVFILFLAINEIDEAMNKAKKIAIFKGLSNCNPLCDRKINSTIHSFNSFGHSLILASFLFENHSNWFGISISTHV